MAVFTWKLFGNRIPEDTLKVEESKQKIEEKEPIFSNNLDKASENTPADEEDSYEISDVVLEAYYLYCLREIDVGEDQESREFLIDRLNQLDDLLFQWVQRGKDLILSLEEEHKSIQENDIEPIQNAARHYAEGVYGQLQGFQKGGDLEQLENELIMCLQENANDLEDIKELTLYLRVLRERLARYSQSKRGRSTIYAQLRELPIYLGNPYRKRYYLYRRLVECKAIANEGRSPTIVYMLLEKAQFDSYYGIRVRNLANHIAYTQNVVCAYNIVLGRQNFQDIYHQLEGELCKYPKSKKEYIKKNRCFSLCEVKLHSGNAALYLCFSGLFDSKDPVILYKFGKYEELEVALDQVETALKRTSGASIVRVRASTDIRYYFDKHRYITLGQVCNQVTWGFNLLKRMFSCCERKFFVELQKIPPSNAKLYTLYIKTAPCELCEVAIHDFDSHGYKCRIVPGGEIGRPVPHKNDYDSLACKINSGITDIHFSIPF